MTAVLSLDDLAARIPDGALVAVPPEYSYVPMALIRALIRRPARDLDLIVVPVGGIGVDMLIGAGCVHGLEAAAVSLGEAGPAPRFSEAARSGAIRMRDSTCPAVHTQLQAAEKGVPFMPLRGLIGSDILAHRDDWRVVDDPLGEGGGPIVLLPAIRPDVAILHGVRADRDGNVWVGRRRELVTMVHAAKAAVATVETVEDTDFLADETTAAGTIPSLYIDAVAEAPRGCWPLGLAGHYAADGDHIRAYAKEARTMEGFRDYIATHATNSAGPLAATS